MIRAVAQNRLKALDRVVVALAIFVENSQVDDRIGMRRENAQAVLVSDDGLVDRVIRPAAIEVKAKAQTEVGVTVVVVDFDRLPITLDRFLALADALEIEPLVEEKR